MLIYYILTHRAILTMLIDRPWHYPAPSIVGSSQISTASALLLHNLARMANQSQQDTVTKKAH